MVKRQERKKYKGEADLPTHSDTQRGKHEILEVGSVVTGLTPGDGWMDAKDKHLTDHITAFIWAYDVYNLFQTIFFILHCTTDTVFQTHQNCWRPALCSICSELRRKIYWLATSTEGIDSEQTFVVTRVRNRNCRDPLTFTFVLQPGKKSGSVRKLMTWCPIWVNHRSPPPPPHAKNV